LEDSKAPALPRKPVTSSEPTGRIEVDAAIKPKLAEATGRLAAAEHEVSLAMEAISLPEHGADNEMIGERLRSALTELRAARLALEAAMRAVP
jgi:hypothetical protein